MATNRRDRVMAARDALRGMVSEYQSEVATVKGNRDTSDTFKTRRLAEIRRVYDDLGRDAAARYVQTVQKAETETRQDLTRALQDAEAGWNYARLQYLTAEYAALLGAQPDILHGETSQVQRLASEYARAAAAQDRESKRALRLAGAPLLASVDINDIEALNTASALKRAWSEDVATERAATAALESELADLQRVAQRIPDDVLSAEAAITGVVQSAFQEPTPWSRTILGEKPRISTRNEAVGAGMPELFKNA